MATVRLLADHEVSPEVNAIFAEIRTLRKTDYVNNFWRALAHQPDNLRHTWQRVKEVMTAGALDPLTKELIYIAVSVANGCDYCTHSHTAAAITKGMTPQQHQELLAVLALAHHTNALSTALQVPVDAGFDADRAT